MDLKGLFSEIIEDSQECTDDFELHAVGAREWCGGGELQRADFLRFVDEVRVRLVELGVVFAVFEEEFDGAEIYCFDAETEDVESFFVDNQGIGAFLQE